MISSQKDSFLKAYKEGKNFIPIIQTWPADLETPLSTWLKLSSKDSHGVFLESVEGGESLGRWSGAAIMHEGDNLMYFARKEQCLALGTQLRAFKPRIEDFKIYRIFPGGDIEFLHPKDGVFPEKVNEGREKVGHNPRRIGENPNPAGLKFTTKNTFD